MATNVSGPLRLVTDQPAMLVQVMVRAPRPRPHAGGMLVDFTTPASVEDGTVSFPCVPGPAVLSVMHAKVPQVTVPLVVPDKDSATLEECIRAAELADDGTLDALEELSLEVARIAAQIASADQLETWASETASAAAQAQISKNEANDAANRAGTHVSNAEQAVSNAKQAELNAKQHEVSASSHRDASAAHAQDALNYALSTANNVREELQDSVQDAADFAAEAKTSESNAATHESNALSAAARAEFAAEETIQQVEGDFATRNYVDSASFARGTLTASDDLDAMADRQYAGAWQVTSTPVAEALGVPSPGFGTVVVFWAAGSSEPYYTATQWWIPAASGDMYKRSIVSRGSWSSWSLIGGDNSQSEEAKQTAAISASTGRADLLRASRGGRVGTGGKAVVSLRFDHNLAAFDSNILTRLRSRQLPATMAFYYDMMSPVDGYSNDDSAAAGKSWLGAQQNFYRGIEVFSHSYSHQDAETLDKMRREIAESRTALESAMPDVRVHGWAMPGIGGSQYMGWWSAWVDPETRLSHAAGQMLGATYGTYNVSGYGLNELGKAQSRYFGVESHTTATASKAHIDRAIATGTGLTLMWHPNQIGADGKMSLAVFDEILDYIVAKRDAGEIMVLTMGGQAVADPSTGWRHSLVPNVSGWSGSASGTLTYNLGLGYLHDATGGMRELEATVTGTGSIKLTVEDTGSTVPMRVYQTQQITGGGTARLAVGIPRRSTTLRLTAECNGVTITNIGLYGI